jgi:hypothetical protein
MKSYKEIKSSLVFMNLMITLKMKKKFFLHMKKT